MWYTLLNIDHLNCHFVHLVENGPIILSMMYATKSDSENINVLV
jgi:hypothetical protein